MAEGNLKAAEALRKLARRVEHGLQRLHPVTDRQLAKVREAVRAEWSKRHKGQEQEKSSQTLQGSQEKEKRKQHDKSKSHDHGHSY
jgi:hypothetical protein